jgi:hypothetical protein
MVSIEKDVSHKKKLLIFKYESEKVIMFQAVCRES